MPVDKILELISPVSPTQKPGVATVTRTRGVGGEGCDEEEQLSLGFCSFVLLGISLFWGPVPLFHSLRDTGESSPDVISSGC